MCLAKLAALRCAWPASFTIPDHTCELGKDAVQQAGAVFIDAAYHICAFESSRHGVREQRILQPGQADSIYWGPVHKCADARAAVLLDGKHPRQADVAAHIGPYNVAGSALREALQARSYKKEVIIMVSDLKRLDSFLQAADSLQHLGLSNVLLLSHTEAMCERISLVVSSIGCAWSSHKHPADLAGNFYVWSLRYRILAR